MRDLYLLLACVAFAALGLAAPFAAALGYIWVDFMGPQRIGHGLIADFPISMLLAVWALLLYLLLDRRDPPPITPIMVLLAAFAVWITLTTTWAMAPQPAWTKWETSIKTITFTLLLPFIFRTRTQLEAMLLVIVLAISGTALAFATKTVIAGSGYGIQLGLFQQNSLLGEGSTVATTALAAAPIALAFARGSKILPSRWMRLGLAYGYTAAAVITAFGSFTRTGLIGVVTAAALFWLGTRRRLLTGVMLVILVLLGMSIASAPWKERMSTISDYQSEVSALGRIGVWRWTLDFVSENPLGGGFQVYVINRTSVPVQGRPGQVLEIRSRAFHSIYFEVLGEHGIPGFFLYMAILAAMFLNLRAAARGEDWIASVAKGLRDSALIYLTCGLFIGIAFLPFLFYLIAASVSLRRLRSRSQPESASKRRADVGSRLEQPAWLRQRGVMRNG